MSFNERYCCINNNTTIPFINYKGGKHELNHSPMPRYYRISNLLRNQIVNGVYKKGEPIPTEKQLSDDFGVSRVTIRQSLSLLEQQGMIVKKQGIGTFVSEDVTIQPIVFTGYIEDIMFQQINTKVVDMKIKEVAPSIAICRNLHLPNNAIVTKVERVRHFEEQVISYVENFFPQHVASYIKEEDVKKHSFVKLLDKYGFVQEKATQNISATAASPEIAKKLEIPINSPVLFSEIIIYSKNNEPLTLVHVYNRSDRYQYTVKLGPLFHSNLKDRIKES
jgi:GntR family transcriptional regulator